MIIINMDKMIIISDDIYRDINLQKFKQKNTNGDQYRILKFIIIQKILK